VSEGRIVVVGSANLDVVVPVPHHPATGETVLGGDHVLIPGGKGANQAVAAARLGGDVAFVGRVGDDDAGIRLRASLDAAGVDTTHLDTDPDTPSGLALIGVDDDGDNAIIVSPGANACLAPDDLDGGLLADAAVVLLQLEVPLDTVSTAVAAATGTVVLNPAPAALLPDGFLDGVDVLVPNRLELRTLAGRDGDDVDLARSLGVPSVVATLGPEGALVVSGGSARRFPAPVVDAVDTTACGDAFCGALAEGLARGLDLDAAVRRSVHAGALTATRAGAQPSLPTSAELAAALDD
jgi:ribokinase